MSDRTAVIEKALLKHSTLGHLVARLVANAVADELQAAESRPTPGSEFMMFCEHANENPNVCPCPSDCACRRTSMCRQKPLLDRRGCCFCEDSERKLTEYKEALQTTVDQNTRERHELIDTIRFLQRDANNGLRDAKGELTHLRHAKCGEFVEIADAGLKRHLDTCRLDVGLDDVPEAVSTLLERSLVAMTAEAQRLHNIIERLHTERAAKSVGAGTPPQEEPPEDRCPTCEGAGVVDMEQLHCELVSSAPVARQLERICEVLSAHIGSDNVHRILQSAEAPTHEPLRCVCGHAATRHRVHSGQNTGRCTEEPHCDCEQFAAAPVPPRGAEPQAPRNADCIALDVPPQLVMLLRQYANDIETCGMEACSAMRDEIVNEMREAADLIERMK